MTNDSTDCLTQEIEAEKLTNGPRISSINFIRQFSRAYVALAGATLGGMVIN